MFNFLKKTNSDRGDSNLISFLFMLPLIVMIFTSTIDVGLFFSNRTMIQNIARDGARTVAIYGGAGDSDVVTRIEGRYNNAMVNRTRCNNTRNMQSFEVTDHSYALNPSEMVSYYNNTECAIGDAISNTPGLVNISIDKIECTPRGRDGYTRSVGQPVKCEIRWDYEPLPLSLFRIVSYPDAMAEDDTFTLYEHNDPSKIALQGNRTVGTASSEVGFAGEFPMVTNHR